VTADSSWLPSYSREWLGADLVAGLVSAAVVIPKAMAFATIAGLPVQVGLYTACVPMLAYAALGTSRPLSVSTTTTIAILVAAELAVVGDPAHAAEVSAALAVLVGAMLAAASLLRLGFVANFISDPVLAGFKSGIGVVIVVDQIPKLLGIHIEKEGFFRDLYAITSHLRETSPVTLGLSAAMLAGMFAMERWTPRLPVPLIAVAAGIAAASLLGLELGRVGEIPRELPALALPPLVLAARIWPAAAGIALMSFTESVAAARAFAVPKEPRPLPNRELFALGAANMLGGLFGAMPAGGGTTQTAVNRSAGARTQAAELVTAAVALATLLVLAPVIALMPNAVLASVVVVYSLSLIKVSEIRAIGRVRATEYYWALIAFAGVVLLGTLPGIVVAVVASLLALAYQTYDPPVYELARKRGTDVFRPRGTEHQDETWPGMFLLRVEGRLYFANAERVGDKIWHLIRETKASVVALDCSALIDVEYTALRMLEEFEEKLRDGGVSLCLVALNPDVLSVVRRCPLGETLGGERLLFNMEQVVERFGKT